MALESWVTAQDEEWTELATGIKNYRPRRLQRYIAVNVLLIYWKDADIPTERDAKPLGQMFREHFNYRPWYYEIVSEENPGLSLHKYLSQFLIDHGGSDKLVLLHYGGHGAASEDGSECIWAK